MASTVTVPAAEASTLPAAPMVPPHDVDRVATQKPLSARVGYFLRLWTMKVLVRSFFFGVTHIKGQNAAERPTYTKSYPSRPNLTAHVFIPKSYKPDDAPLPLLIDIHGGGFCIGAPLMDDRDNASFAHTHGVVVVSLQYRLAPSYPFPAGVEDIAAQIADVLDDPDLPVDRTKVATLGYSAGANFALAAPQLHGLATRLAAAVAYYPPVDFAAPPGSRMANRTPHPDGRPDMLEGGSQFFNWGYVNPGTRLRDPTLSPRYAGREKLPKHVYILGSEYDLLCQEANEMAEELAEKEDAPKIQDQRDGDEGWECGAVRWKRVKGVEHGFNQLVRFKSKAEEELYRHKTVECQKDVIEWLRRVAWAEKPAA